MNILSEPEILLDSPELSEIPLPKGWSALVLQSLLHLITVARIAMLNARTQWPKGDLALRAEIERLRNEMALLTREIEIKDARMKRISPHERPRYEPTERFGILAIQAARGCNQVNVAKQFLVSAATIRSWKNAVEKGNDLVGLSQKVTRYPDYIRTTIQWLKTTCPFLGRHKLAAMLARIGLHISASTVRRVVNEPPTVFQETKPEPNDEPSKEIVAEYKNHVWSFDLTEVSMDGGFGISMRPFVGPLRFPFGWFVLNVIDHHTRRAMGFAVFSRCPTADDVLRALTRIIAENGVVPKHTISDRGKQFDCAEYRSWCKAFGIKSRFGKVGKHGSIAVTERLNGILKSECTKRILVPINQADMEHEIGLWISWYNRHRPHTKLGGRTPDECYFELNPENEKPRIELRRHVTANTPCAGPRVEIAKFAEKKVTVNLRYLEGRRHLPILSLQRE